MLALLLALACSRAPAPAAPTPPPPPEAPTMAPAPVAPTPAAAPVLDLPNATVMQEKWALNLSLAQVEQLTREGFVQLRLPQTSIRPELWYDIDREFIKLYDAVSGPKGYAGFRDRTEANTLFLTTDVFLHTFNLIYTELLKEVEIRHMQPALTDLCRVFYEDAASRVKDLDAAALKDPALQPGPQRVTWARVRDLFAVPLAILSTTGGSLDTTDYYENGEMKDPDAVERAHRQADTSVDTADNVGAFVKKLGLDPESERAVLADISQIYGAKAPGVPAVLAPAYEEHATQTGQRFQVDFTQFTPRSHYTTTSGRRQYFRAMSWFTQVPLFVASPALADVALSVGELMRAHKPQLQAWKGMNDTIGFMVGEADDLDPLDAVKAVESGDPRAALLEAAKARPPRIKSLSATYADVGKASTEAVRTNTAGVRLFSGRYLLDSDWTGRLTQGDEAPLPGYPAKLPPMASSLQVMTLLGSSYARTRLPDLPFYRPPASLAVDRALQDLDAHRATLDDGFWGANLYHGWLRTLSDVFVQPEGKRQAFQSSPLWAARLLQTASGSWTELRHATLLYAKQSFAEMGDGGDCDTRPVPPPARGWVEPAPQVYDRLLGLTRRLETTLQQQGYKDLMNYDALTSLSRALEEARRLAKKELADEKIVEKVGTHQEYEGCVEHVIEGTSDWEVIRSTLVNALLAAQPRPADGPIVPEEDRRAALVADVHTGGDSQNPTQILYQGTGVPSVILVAVNDANGPRLAIGFTYSHYEFTRPYGGPRLTDNDWRAHFYANGEYTDPATWPEVNAWYKGLYPGG